MALTPVSDENSLLSKISRGDKTAFSLLFNHYHGYVFAFSRKLTRSDEMANEIVQDIFLKLWIGREKLVDVDSFGAYLNRLVRNHSFNVLRQLAQELKLKTFYFDESAILEETTTRTLEFKESERILNEAIVTLSKQQRMVYELCHRDGLTYEQAAAQMNISAQTVHSYMKDALKKIRSHFKKFGVHYSLLMACLFK
jgi:RNA polymerase sigma-70 factor (family 1)